MKERDESMDSLKVFLIWLVVLGHLLSVNHGKAELVAHTYIFLFHMPLFALISGFFTNTSNTEKLISGTMKLFETFIVWHIIGFFIIGILIWHHELSLNNFIVPIWHYWYLLSLVCWRLLAFTIDKYICGFYKPVLIPLSYIIALLVGYIRIIDYPFSLSRTIVFAPFFLIGWYLRSSKIMFSMFRDEHKKWISSLIMILLALLVFYYPYWGRAIYGAESYFNDVYDIPFQGFVMRVAFLSTATLLSLAVLNLWSGIKILSFYGKYTLHVLIIHSWLILLFKKLLPINLPIAIVLSVVIMFVSTYIAKFRLSSILLNPLSFIYENWNKRGG